MARSALGDDAQHFAADTQTTRLPIRHHALGRRDDRNTQPVHHVRYIARGLVDTQAGTAHAFDLLDHGSARVILEADLELRLAAVLANGVIIDVALVLEHLGNRGFQL